MCTTSKESHSSLNVARPHLADGFDRIEAVKRIHAEAVVAEKSECTERGGRRGGRRASFGVSEMCQTVVGCTAKVRLVY